MKQQIASFSVGQSSKILAYLYGIFGLIFIPIGALIALLDDDRIFGTGLVIFYLCAPLIYLVFGYVFGLISFWAYNFIAKRAGGIEFELREST